MIVGSDGKIYIFYIVLCVYMYIFFVTSFPKRPHYFAFSSAMNKSSLCSTSSPALGVFSVLDFCYSNRCVVIYLTIVVICNLLLCNTVMYMLYNTEHLFINLFVIYMSCFLRCLFKSFVHFFKEVIF